MLNADTTQNQNLLRASPDRNVEFLTWQPGRRLVFVGALWTMLELTFVILHAVRPGPGSADLALLFAYVLPLFFILASGAFRFVALPDRTSAGPKLRTLFDAAGTFILVVGAVRVFVQYPALCETYLTLLSQYLAVTCAVWAPVLTVMTASCPARQKEPSLHGVVTRLRRIGLPSPVLAAGTVTAALLVLAVHRLLQTAGADVPTCPGVVRTLAAVWTFAFIGTYLVIFLCRRYRRHDERPDIAHASAEGASTGAAFLFLAAAPFSPFRVASFSILYVCARLVRLHAITQKHRRHLIRANDNEYLSLYYKACSDVDGMTGLYNKQYFTRTVPALMEQSRTDRSGLALLMFDIDKFKRYNDTFGHLAGDRALIFTARVMQSTLRKTDMPFRYGGEEFCAVLVNTEEPAAIAIAERIRSSVMMKSGMLASEAMAEHLVEPNADGSMPDMSLTVSVGVTMMRDDDSMESIVVRADGALYKAKNSGRNRTEYA